MAGKSDKDDGESSSSSSSKPAVSKPASKSSKNFFTRGNMVQPVLAPVKSRSAGIWPDGITLVQPEGKTSGVWTYFEMEPVEKGVKNALGQSNGYGNFVYCILCKPARKADGVMPIAKKSGTSHYFKHLERCHPAEYKKVAGQQGLESSFQKGVRR